MFLRTSKRSLFTNPLTFNHFVRCFCATWRTVTTIMTLRVWMWINCRWKESNIYGEHKPSLWGISIGQIAWKDIFTVVNPHHPHRRDSDTLCSGLEVSEMKSKCLFVFPSSPFNISVVLRCFIFLWYLAAKIYCNILSCGMTYTWTQWIGTY